ncbi:MAG: hypothetical protein H0W73_18350 [Bacteroidetes bacterium]|nr:hypothetical protein [Bacteroidota bacterium]
MLLFCKVMLKNKFIKISLTVFILMVALWIATPSTYTNKLFNYNTTSLSIKPEAKVETQAPADMDYKKPVYFNIFKFVTNLIPGKK